MDVKTFQDLGLHEDWGDIHAMDYQVNGRANIEIAQSLSTPGDLHYHPCPEGLHEGELQGITHVFDDWDQSDVYSRTRRKIAVYLPPQAAVEGPLNLLICNDGEGYRYDKGSIRVPAVLDSLLQSESLGPTAAVFVMPGIPDGMELSVPGQMPNAVVNRQRSFEYDSCTPLYGQFLLTEVLPFLERELDLNITTDPGRRAVCGISSGGICAFNTAWHHPGHFARVISHCGSFTNIRGAHNFPYLIRSTPRKPLRVFLQSGELDANIVTGSWPLANKEMAAALDFAGYDYRFEFGTGGHNLRHGGAIFADTLRWAFGAKGRDGGRKN